MENFQYLKIFLEDFQNILNYQTYSNVRTPWLAFPLVIRENKKFNRKQLQIFYEKNHVQTRTIFTGNILRQPIMKNLKYRSHKNSGKVANDVMKNGILLGCHQGLKIDDLSYITKMFLKFAKLKNLTI